VTSATFKQMSLVENYLHQILRRKALKSALDRKPLGVESVQRLTMALHRHLNKTDRGHEELRQAVRDADNGDPDIDLLYSLAKDYLDQLEDMPDRKAIAMSLQLLTEIAGALDFAGMEREGRVIAQCHKWLQAASKAGSVREDEAFACFADAFAQVEMHLQRSIADPLDDTSHMITFAEQRAAELERWIGELSSGADVTAAADDADSDVAAPAPSQVKDAEIPPQFRDVFIEEAEEIVTELKQLAAAWAEDPQVDSVLRDIRRHFHTFKGNGRAVGANVLGELGWASQDMLDRVLDGELIPDDAVQQLVEEVVAALPDLVQSYKRAEGPDMERIRQLTNACFCMAEGRDLELDLAEELVDDSGALEQGLQAIQSTVVTETLTH
jgi:HPt (histidine-containing phosphotransfer) domain-containing protein